MNSLRELRKKYRAYQKSEAIKKARKELKNKIRKINSQEVTK